MAVITLNRPPANAIDQELLSYLGSAFVSAIQQGARAIVITGFGRFFASGADITFLARLAAAEFREFVTNVQTSFQEIELAPVPTIAAINGFAVGGGLELALACDVRLMSLQAQVGMPEGKLGLVPAAGGTQRLTRAVGKGRALDLLYSGRSLTADRALKYGVVEHTAPPDQLLPQALECAKTWARMPSKAMIGLKHCVLTGLTRGLSAGLQAEIDVCTDLFATPEAQDAIQEFGRSRGEQSGRGRK